MMTLKLILLGLGTMGLVWVSRASLREVNSHGFYRFFAWETILVLIALNLEFWFVDPWRPVQIISWILLIVSITLVIQGVTLLGGKGQPDPSRDDPSLIGMEKTTELVTEGLYGLIRHPLYSSLLFLSWGAFFKDPSWAGGCLAVVASVFLTKTARIEELENIAYFGEAYRSYIGQTKMFIPFLF